MAKPYVPAQENAVPNPLQLPLFGKDFEPETDAGHKRRKPWAVALMNDASSMMLRSLLPAPMHWCVRGSRKSNASQRRRSRSEPRLSPDAYECTNS